VQVPRERERAHGVRIRQGDEAPRLGHSAGRLGKVARVDGAPGAQRDAGPRESRGNGPRRVPPGAGERAVGGSVIAVREVPDERVPSLGIIDARQLDRDVYEVAGLVEKPSLRDAPSNLAIIGRYVLTPQIFEVLEKTLAGAIGEIQITDAISQLLSTQKVYAYRFPGDHFDVGTPMGLLKASVHAALQREELADELREWLTESVGLQKEES